MATGIASASDHDEPIEPITRSGRPKFKFSLAGYSYRDLFKPNNKFAKEALTLHDFVERLRKDAARGDGADVVLLSHAGDKRVSDRSARGSASGSGWMCPARRWATTFAIRPGRSATQQIRAVKQWIDHAAVLGAPVIRIFSGSVKRDQTEAEAHRLAVAGDRRVLRVRRQEGDPLGPGEPRRADRDGRQGCSSLVKDVKSPWFGVNLDSGNFHGEDVYGELAQIAPYTRQRADQSRCFTGRAEEGSLRISSGWRRSSAMRLSRLRRAGIRGNRRRPADRVPEVYRPLARGFRVARTQKKPDLVARPGFRSNHLAALHRACVAAFQVFKLGSEANNRETVDSPGAGARWRRRLLTTGRWRRRLNGAAFNRNADSRAARDTTRGNAGLDPGNRKPGHSGLPHHRSRSSRAMTTMTAVMPTAMAAAAIATPPPQSQPPSAAASAAVAAVTGDGLAVTAQ